MGEFVRAASVADLSEGCAIAVSIPELDRVKVCIAKMGGKYYAFSNVCTHIGGPLNEGKVGENHIVCPWHFAHFRPVDGANFFPAQRRIRTFKVKIEGDDLLLGRT